MPRPFLFLAAVLVVLIAACGGDDSDTGLDEVASLGGSSGDDRTDESDRPTFEEGLLSFTTCMRENGVEVPDIAVDADGQPRLNPDVIGDLDTSTPEFSSAVGTCLSFLADAAPVDLSTDPELNAVVQDQLRQFSQCMRAEGVTDFPDPNPNFDGSGLPYPLTALNPQNDAFPPALQECQSLLSFPTS